MTPKKDNTRRGPSGPGRSRRLHFGIAAGILAVTAVGFEYTIAKLKLVTQKEPIPWPSGVLVNQENFRWVNLPEQVGNRYFLAEDGELSGEKDGQPDGELIVPPDVLDSLKIGTSLDKQRVAERTSNWYVSRRYRDNTRPAGDPLRYWQLEVYYYTGVMDTVPHVPDICMAAAGATQLGSRYLTMSIPAAPSPWDQPLEFQRSGFEIPDPRTSQPQRRVEYYVFSVNGEPETSREKVRLKLMSIFDRYSYFSKIQFSPVFASPNDAEADRAAEELMNCFLPVIFRALPLPDHIKALEAGREGRGD